MLFVLRDNCYILRFRLVFLLNCFIFLPPAVVGNSFHSFSFWRMTPDAWRMTKQKTLPRAGASFARLLFTGFTPRAIFSRPPG